VEGARKMTKGIRYAAPLAVLAFSLVGAGFCGYLIFSSPAMWVQAISVIGFAAWLVLISSSISAIQKGRRLS